MHPVDIKAALESAEVLVDTREQITGRAERRLKSLQLPYKRCTLKFCDYAINCTLPDGSQLYDTSRTVMPHTAVIERKMSLDELEGCLTRSRDRFEREFTRARDAGAPIYLLIEGATWENILTGNYRSRMHPKAFECSLTTLMVRYDLHLIFCREATSGELIREILMRDLRERLNNGTLIREQYDN